MTATKEQIETLAAQVESAAVIMAADADVKELVSIIEESPKTTQDHYGQYMTFLAGITERANRAILARAFVLAGANQFGVASAMRIIG